MKELILISTPIQSPVSSQSSEDNIEESDKSSTPKRLSSMNDICGNTKKIEVEEELLFLGVEEPDTYNLASKESPWKDAMKIEMEDIERNNTRKLEVGI